MKNKITHVGLIPVLLFIFSILNLSVTENATAQWLPTSGVSGGTVYSFLSSGSNLFIGTIGYGVYKSTDNGTTWFPSNNGFNSVLSNIVISLTVAGSNILAGTSNGIYYSSNSGANWNVGDTVLTKNKFVYALSTLGTAGYVFAGTNYIGTTDPKTTFVSTNNGVTWAATTTNPVFTGTNTSVYSLREFGGNLYAGTSHSVYRTVNFGANWIQMTGGTMGTDKQTYSLTAIGTTKLLAGTISNGVYWSIDNGTTWNPQNTGLPASSTVYSLTTIGSNIFLPSFGNVVYQATDGSSLSWSATTSTGLFNKYDYTIFSVGSTLYLGSAGAGLFISNNNASSWTRSNSGIKADPVNCLTNNGSTLFAGMSGNGVFVSTNNGDNWAQADNTNLGDPVIRTIMPYSTNIFVGTNNGIFVSGNNGTTWSNASSGLPANTQINSLTQSSSNLFAGAENAHVYKSSNNGATWGDLGTVPSAVSCFTTIGINIFLGMESNGVGYSLNGGTTWSLCNTGLTNLSVHSLSSLGSTNLFAGTERGVFLSTNTGANWNRVSNKTNGMDSIYTINTLANDGTYVIAGTNNGIFLTSDMGATWQKKNQGLGADTTVNNLLITNNTVFAAMTPFYPIGTNTSPLVWKRAISNISIGIKTINSEVPDKFEMMQNYPNPFNPSTIIRFQIKESRFVTLKVYNITGQEIATLVNEKLQPGVYEIPFSVDQYTNTQISSGVYFYRLITDGFTETKKMIMIK